MKALASKQPSTESSRAKRPAHAPVSRIRTHPAHQAPILQRKAGCACGGGCPRCQENELALQTKLKIGQPGDKYEQEADRVALEVMRMPEPTVQRQVEQEEDEELVQTKPLITPLVQRQVEEEKEEDPTLQAKEHPGQTPTVTPSLASRINSLRGGGQALPKSVRSFFEPRFGRDFGQVRVHTGAQAATSARAVNARAFTVGQNVVFGAGQYAPATSEGQRLLAHELTHVVQQNQTAHHPAKNVSHTISPKEEQPSSKTQNLVGYALKITTLSPQIQRYSITNHLFTPRTLDSARSAVASFDIDEAKTGQWEIRNPGNLRVGNPCIRSSSTNGIRVGHRTCTRSFVERHLQNPGLYKSRIEIGEDVHETSPENSLKIVPQIRNDSVNPDTGITGFDQSVTLSLRITSPAAGFQGRWEIINAAGNMIKTCQTGALRGALSCRWNGLIPRNTGRAGPLAVGGPFKTRIVANKVVVYISNTTFDIDTRFQLPANFGASLDTRANRDLLAQIINGEMRGQNRSERIAVGWVAINRVLRSNTADLDQVTAGEFARRANPSQEIQDLARDLVAGSIADPTNGSTMFFSPRSMPAAGQQGCCSGNRDRCPAPNIDDSNCRGGLQDVPGTDPAKSRFFPGWANTLTRQPQPAGTDPMNILVYTE